MNIFRESRAPCPSFRVCVGMLAACAAMFAPRSACGAEESGSVDDLLKAGRQLWEDYAPDEIKEQYEFPSAQSLERFLTGLEGALAEGSFEALAAYELEARHALVALRRFEGGDLLADWLEPRLDYLTAARLVAPPVTHSSMIPRARPAPLSRPYWDHIVVQRQPPARAGKLVPRLKQIFAAEGVPAAWVWIAEVESSMNPDARSPAGARGLFQFMPATAERFGMRVSVFDERTDPEKSARAAAQYLRFLHGRFDSWPLALAAYNAGEGRVGRDLKASGSSTFPAVAPRLPAETRMYVPKVLATVAARESVNPETLPPPTAR